MKLYMKQKVFSWVDRYKIVDENQKLKYRVEGKFLSMHGKMNLIKNDKVIYRFSHRLLTFFNRCVDIYNHQGDHMGVFIKHFSFFTPRISVEMNNKSYQIKGEIFAHDFMIYQDSNLIAVITKKWFTWGDSYEIDVIDEEDTDFIVALVIGIDTTIHNSRYESHNHVNTF